MKQRIFFTGGSGLLAINWALAIANDFEVVNGLHERMVSLPGIATRQVDLENAEAFAGQLRDIRPAVVIHCAGLTEVEKCEANPALAEHANVDLAAHAALACSQLGIRFVYISTDHLFAGDTPLHTEEEPVAPVNVYGITKARAEKKVLEIDPGHLCIRTNFYGWGTGYRHSFSDRILSHLKEAKTISLFEDVFYTPILIAELARVVMKLLAVQAGGIFNVAGNERISKYAFGIRLAKEFGLDASWISPIKFAERTDLVRRPLDLSLSSRKAAALLNGDFGDIVSNIRELHRQEQDGLSAVIKNI